MEGFVVPDSPTHVLFVAFLEERPGAMQKIQELFEAPLRGFAFNIIGDAEEVEDIVSRAFYAGWCKRKSFTNLKKLWAYLYVVVKHGCFQWREKRKQAQQLRTQAGYLYEPHDEPQVLKKLISREQVQLVHKAIERLPGRHRQLLTMMYIEELSTRQVSLQLQIPEDHVRVNKARALQYLRRELNSRYSFQ